MASSRSKRSIVDLSGYIDKSITVKFTGGREVTGVLKGYDELINLVMDEAVEHIQDVFDPYRITDKTRQLGLTVCRGTSIMLVCPSDGTREIENPFVKAQQSIA